VLRTGISIEVVQSGVKMEQDNGTISKELIRLAYYKGNYWLFNPLNIHEKQEPLLMVLREYINEHGFPGMKFKQGDLMKFGRCCFLVKEIVGETKEELNEVKEENKLTQNEVEVDAIHDFNEIKLEVVLNKDEHEDQLESSMSSEKDKEEKEEGKKTLSVCSNDIKCRICLGEESTKENPIISSPCKCSGSVKFIHKNCLQLWLDSKILKHKSQLCSSYYWKEFECDVCKTKYSGTCILIIETITCPDGQSIKIITIEKPKKHYMILEEINNANFHQLFIILLDKQNTLKIVHLSPYQHREGTITVM
jgi:hypothetical protein